MPVGLDLAVLALGACRGEKVLYESPRALLGRPRARVTSPPRLPLSFRIVSSGQWLWLLGRQPNVSELRR